MKQLNYFIQEKLKLNKDYKEPEKNKPEDLIIQIKDKEYKYSIGPDLPIIDHAESYEEAITMIERDSEEGDRFHWLRPLENGNWTASPDFYWTKYIDNRWPEVLLKSSDGDKYKKENIESMYNTQHLILVKVEKNK